MDVLAMPTVAHTLDGDVTLPGSKSITNRALLAAALADGRSTLEEALFSEDTEIFSDCLRRLGFEVASDSARRSFEVAGRGGAVPATEADLFVGNAGTAARFITALTGLGAGTYRFDGVAAMRKRPMRELLDVLEDFGATVEYGGEPGAMPFALTTRGFAGGAIETRADRTSQHLTALLLIAPYAARDTTISVGDTLVSRPYLVTTCGMMEQWGVHVEREGETVFHIRAGQRYQPQRFVVEPDASGASYFFAAAAALGGRVRVRNLGRGSLQGDARFVDVLEAMGCDVVRDERFIEVSRSGPLRGVDVDLNDMSDTMPTLAAIAPFAEGPVTIRNVEHTRWKETDRIHAVVTELRRMGASVEERRDGLTVSPGPLHAATVQTYNDHRIAMSFGITGLRVPGTLIADPACTAKTFPDFFDRLFALIGHRA
ncbi:MAG TPA: 3-phosphoshikimate 1-carboxyvinyltransferase [Roseiflexaceae bacterium]|nr:3-phosphoshikimate 1-carboxyvinyltransferase [Roseiflexaceae bacterium]